MGNGSDPVPDCTGILCGYGVAEGEVGCNSGDGSCLTALLAEARESAFHPRELQDATRQIKTILDSLQSTANGRQLSFIHTRMGILLAWVTHGEIHAEGTITSANTDAEIAEALGLLLDSEQSAEAY